MAWALALRIALRRFHSFIFQWRMLLGAALFFAFSGARLLFKIDEEEDITASVDTVLS